MKRRLQVFVCSTYEDLRLERQAAVEAILKAGHIPAGMELFTAGSESQLQAIQRWIEDSDLFLLILGGRYGSIEPASGLSYIEVEFEFARNLSKPFFSVVITQEGLETKVKATGMSVIEQQNADKLQKFRDKVTSQMCGFFSNEQEVKLAIFETLPQFSENISVGGWVKASEVTPSEDVAKQLTRLLDENQKLRLQSETLSDKLANRVTGSPDFKQLATTLANEKITIPAKLSGTGKTLEQTLLSLTVSASDELARGVSNQKQAPVKEVFLFYNVASRLAAYGLAEHAKVPPSVYWQRLKLSKDGVKFVTQAKMKLAAKTPEKKANAENSKVRTQLDAQPAKLRSAANRKAKKASTKAK